MKELHIDDIDVTVVVPTCNRRYMLKSCLESLAAQTLRPARIIVLDQSDVHLDVHEAASYGVDVLPLDQKNKSHALNAAISHCTTTYCAVIDDDCIADKEWLSRLMNSAISQRGCSVVTGRVLAGEIENGSCRSRLDDPVDRPAVYHRRTFTPTFVLSGCNFVFTKDLISHVGTFDERFGPGSMFMSGEDNEWSYRVFRAGHSVYYEPSAVVYHRSWRSKEQDLQLMSEYGFAAGGFFSSVYSKSAKDFLYYLCKTVYWLSYSLLKNAACPEKRRPFAAYLRNLCRGMLLFRSLR